MKRFFASFLVAIIFSFGVLPAAALAIEAEDPEFEAFLDEIGWEKQDYVDYLESKEWGLDYFWDVTELGTPLSEEGIQAVLDENGLSREELNALLEEYGDLEPGQDVLDGEWLIFNEDLNESVAIYASGEPMYEGTPIDDANLQELLDTYGYASIEELEAFLNENGDSLDYFASIEDLESSIEYYTYEYDTEYEEGFDEEYYTGDFSDLSYLYGSGMEAGGEDAFLVLVPMFFKILFD